MAEGEIGNQPHLSSLWHHEQARNDVLYELRESSVGRGAAAVRRSADVSGARSIRRRDARPAIGVGRGAAQANRPHEDRTSPAPHRRAPFFGSARPGVWGAPSPPPVAPPPSPGA